MANAKICDRCKNFYVPNIYKATYRMVALSPTPSNYKKNIDLCPECEKDLARWFKEKKEKN